LVTSVTRLVAVWRLMPRLPRDVARLVSAVCSCGNAARDRGLIAAIERARERGQRRDESAAGVSENGLPVEVRLYLVSGHCCTLKSAKFD
jgi:hypothetical protein